MLSMEVLFVTATLVFGVGALLSLRAILRPKPLLSRAVLVPAMAAGTVNVLVVLSTPTVTLVNGFVAPLAVVCVGLAAVFRFGPTTLQQALSAN